MEEKMHAGQNATELLREDHVKVKDLFERFEEAEDSESKKNIAQTAIHELKVHAAIEEEIFYPTVNQNIEADDLINEAKEEHHVAKLLISELEDMDAGDERFEAKFKVLAESVKHHIREEEENIFPQLEQSSVDLASLGRQIGERKLELAEEMEAVSSSRGRKTASSRNGRAKRTRKKAA